ncbi:hypothetical protein G5I_02995 [Acromyrmex echinatior]|uniref:Uncharacterized protein n=1 Tax=Acromyrmex echinatior TaxID=103372 RepID=F4WBS4_ACREC|nr:hypothetical protein G5I_02995 [Acromyrmex echinatior]
MDFFRELFLLVPPPPEETSARGARGSRKSPWKSALRFYRSYMYTGCAYHEVSTGAPFRMHEEQRGVRERREEERDDEDNATRTRTRTRTTTTKGCEERKRRRADDGGDGGEEKGLDVGA